MMNVFNHLLVKDSPMTPNVCKGSGLAASDHGHEWLLVARAASVKPTSLVATYPSCL